jgi:UDP-N-acetylmuramoyl-L-alanyl-D-glutamate--2,6-diaminopimelate ligase
MNLLFEGIDVVETRGETGSVDVASIELDSRAVAPGALFCCLPGRVTDGHDYAPDALARGATSLLVERPLDLPVVQAIVGPGRARPTMARIACAFNGNPARSLVTVGVTGTNGKTTVAHLLGAVFDAHRMPVEVVGTLDGDRTTPESPHLQRRLAGALAAGCRAAVLEVSSHALTESRVDGIVFDAAVFTNLSHDHLDHHGTMERYFAAKASLFAPERARLGVVNIDDPYGARLAADSPVPVVTFGAVDATDVVTHATGTSFTWHGRRVELALAGAHNVMNALAAATTAVALGVPDDTVVAGLGAAGPVPGRFEVVDGDGACTVVVDYAHTPDGLRVSLDSARRLAAGGRVLCVFGCGGDRDRAKRPAMGSVAAAGADVVVVTSDNPRSEDPAAIIADVLRGITDEGVVVVEPDRATAIERAVDLAGPGDVVIVAGKGHETTIETAGASVPFDDRAAAAAALSRRRARAAGGGRPQR